MSNFRAILWLPAGRWCGHFSLGMDHFFIFHKEVREWAQGLFCKIIAMCQIIFHAKLILLNYGRFFDGNVPPAQLWLGIFDPLFQSAVTLKYFWRALSFPESCPTVGSNKFLTSPAPTTNVNNWLYFLCVCSRAGVVIDLNYSGSSWKVKPGVGITMYLDRWSKIFLGSLSTTQPPPPAATTAAAAASPPTGPPPTCRSAAAAAAPPDQ